MKRKLPTHLHHARSNTQCLEKHLAWDMGLAASGIQTLGDMLHLHSIDGTSRLTESEVEGLCLAVTALGRYVGKLQVDLEETASTIVEFIEKEGDTKKVSLQELSS